MTVTPSKIDTRNTAYMNLHQWVKRHYGKATHCTNDSTHINRYYEWANVTGTYERDLENFKQLCRSCHRKLDHSDFQRKLSSNRFKGNRYQRKAVEQYTKQNDYLKTFPTMEDAARSVGVVRTALTNAITGRSKTAGGYRWRVVN